MTRTHSKLLLFCVLALGACVAPRSDTAKLSERVKLDWVPVTKMGAEQSSKIIDSVSDLALELGEKLLRSLVAAAADSYAAEWGATRVFQPLASSEDMAPGLLLLSRTVSPKKDRTLTDFGLEGMTTQQADDLVDQIITDVGVAIHRQRLKLTAADKTKLEETLDQHIAATGVSRTVAVYVVAVVPVGNAYRLFHVGRLHDALKARALSDSIPWIGGDKTSTVLRLNIVGPRGNPLSDYAVATAMEFAWSAEHTGWKPAKEPDIASPLFRSPIRQSPLEFSLNVTETNRAKGWLSALSKDE